MLAIPETVLTLPESVLTMPGTTAHHPGIDAHLRPESALTMDRNTQLRLWKWELQRFANRTGLAITVCHFPPGTSKWNRIEHRLFSHIAMNWRGTPLVDLATIVSLIGSTHSTSGLRVRSEIDRGRYPGGVSITDAQLSQVRLERHRFHGDWNYTIRPVNRQRHQ